MPTVEELVMQQLYAEYPNKLHAHNELETLSNFQLLERISNAIEQRLAAAISTDDRTSS